MIAPDTNEADRNPKTRQITVVKLVRTFSKSSLFGL
jgi:hypothetical protein